MDSILTYRLDVNGLGLVVGFQSVVKFRSCGDQTFLHFSKLMRPKARSASQPKTSLIDERGSGANKLGCTKSLCLIEQGQTLNVRFSSNDYSQSSKEECLWPGVKFAKMIMIRVSALR